MNTETETRRVDPAPDDAAPEARLGRLVPELVARLVSAEVGFKPRAVLDLIAAGFGDATVALRLRQGEGFPIYCSHGLDETFLVFESPLCPCGAKQVLPCLCGAVLEGRSDPRQPWWTARGSFICHDTFAVRRDPRLLENTPELRGRCFDEGFRSLALLPVRRDGEMRGLLHVARAEPNAFLHAVPTLELVADLVALALPPKRSDGHRPPAPPRAPRARLGADRLLLVEDNRADARLLEILLDEQENWRGRLAWVKSFAEARTAMEAEAWDAVLLDMGLPDAKHFEALEGLRDLRPETPVIILTGNDDESLGLEAVQHGAQDYLVKGRVDGDMLLRSLRYAMERKNAEFLSLRQQKLRSVGELAGGMAHDFNNLVAVIQANVSLLKSVPSPAKAQQIIEDVDRACVRAKSLTDRLLTFSRGGAPIRRPADLKALLESLMPFFLAGRSVSFEISAPDDLHRASVDEGQLSQAIENVVSNAIRAMDGRGRLAVTLADETLHDGGPHSDGPRSLPPGDYVRIRFSDDGPGIDASLLPRVFDPYFTTWSGRSGLGLATTYSILRRHEGIVELRDRPEGGCEVSFLIPALPPVTEQADEIGGERALRLLVVDDEALIRRMSQSMLGHLGHACEVASSSREAVERYGEALARGTPFDLVLMDLTLPGDVGGVATLAKLRELDPAVRAIVSSGYSDDPVMAEPELHGFSGVLAKPYRLDDLRRILSRGLAPRRD